MISPLGYKILTKLPVVGQDTIVSSTSLPLSREVLSDYTNVFLKVIKLYTRHSLGQYIFNLLICPNILELYSSPLHHIMNVVIPYFYVLLLFMEHVSTRSHLWIAAEVSPVPISLHVTMSKLRGVKWVQAQENIALTQKYGSNNA
jgi:hypothetical protein